MPIPPKEELDKLYKEKTDQEIATLFNVSSSSVRRWRRQYSIPSRPRGPRTWTGGARIKYTKDKLEKLAVESFSVCEVIRKLGLRESGGNHNHISKRLRSYEISTQHFRGKGANFGIRHKGGPRKKTWQERLVKRAGNKRQAARLLRRALVESGIKYQCNECKISEWNGKEVTLHVNHIDGDWLNDSRNNLEFLCPNCHSQTPTWGSKNMVHVA